MGVVKQVLCILYASKNVQLRVDEGFVIVQMVKESLIPSDSPFLKALILLVFGITCTLQ